TPPRGSWENSPTWSTAADPTTRAPRATRRTAGLTSAGPVEQDGHERQVVEAGAEAHVGDPLLGGSIELDALGGADGDDRRVQAAGRARGHKPGADRQVGGHVEAGTPHLAARAAAGALDDPAGRAAGDGDADPAAAVADEAHDGAPARDLGHGADEAGVDD